MERVKCAGIIIVLFALTTTSLFGFYDPSVGRFLNRDPLEEPGGLNLYAFCNGDPVNNIDYLGKVVILIHGVNTDAAWFDNAKIGLENAGNTQAIIGFKWFDNNRILGADKQGGLPNYATDSVNGMNSTGWFSKERGYMKDAVRRFKFIIDRLNKIKRETNSHEPITVIAHSQGTIITLGALQNGAVINNFIMMGSPLDVWPYDFKNNDLVRVKKNILGETYNYWSKGDEWARQKGGIGAHGDELAKLLGLRWITNREFGVGLTVNGYKLPDEAPWDSFLLLTSDKEFDHSEYMSKKEFFQYIHFKDIAPALDNKVSNHHFIERLKRMAIQ